MTEMSELVFNIKKKIKKNVVMKLCKKAKDIFKVQPNLLRIPKIPKKGLCVVGDIHGNFFDLCKILHSYGTEEDRVFLFLGDYVDRGPMSLRVILAIFAFVVEKNFQIFCLRGNHETLSVSANYGLLGECIQVYGREKGKIIFCAIVKTFVHMPLAAVVANKFFCVHGGLGPSFTTLKDLEKINRVLPDLVENMEKMTQMGGYYQIRPVPAIDLLWSDPSENCKGFSHSKRGFGYLFGKDVTERFLKVNNLKMIIRSHENCQNGKRLSHGSKVLTVFSSSNYQGGDNEGAYAVIKSGGIKIVDFRRDD